LSVQASCHGKEGKGDAPVARALKVPPADLTALSKRNNGKFPSAQVVNAITGLGGQPAHGSKEMPVWGPIFMTMEHQHESEVHLRVANLANYIKSLQQK
jgi:mono/diheme cytochrome c family protein